MGVPDRRSDDDLERPPAAWLPVVVIGGLALFGAISLVKFAINMIFSLAGVILVVAIVGGIAWILVKGYKGPPD